MHDAMISPYAVRDWSAGTYLQGKVLSLPGGWNVSTRLPPLRPWGPRGRWGRGGRSAAAAQGCPGVRGGQRPSRSRCPYNGRSATPPIGFGRAPRRHTQRPRRPRSTTDRETPTTAGPLMTDELPMIDAGPFVRVRPFPDILQGSAAG